MMLSLPARTQWVWVGCFLLFPAWYLPMSDGASGAAWVFLAGASAVAFACARRLAPAAREEFPSKRLGAPSGFEAGLALLFLAGQIHFLSIPVLPVADAHLHLGLPALAVRNVSRAMPGGPSLLRVLCAAWLVAGLWIWLRPPRAVDRFLSNWNGWVFLHAAAACWAFFLGQGEFLERFGNPAHLLRYPALGKMVDAAAFSVVGIFPWLHTAAESFFCIGAAWQARSIAAGLSGTGAGTLAYAAVLFLPPIFSYAHQGYLDCGAVFLGLVTCRRFWESLEEGRVDKAGSAALWATAAVAWKPSLGYLPVFFAASWFAWRWSHRQRLCARMLALAAVPPFSAAAFSVVQFECMQRAAGHADFPSLSGYWGGGFSAAGAAVCSYWKALGWPVAVTLGMALVWGVAACRRAVWMGLLGFGVPAAFLFHSAAMGWTRHLLPAITWLPIIAAAAVGPRLDHLGSFPSRLCAALVGGGFGLWGLWGTYADAVNLANLADHTVPYDQAFKFLADSMRPGEKVLAPMGCEPSHFYMAKYGRPGLSQVERKPWEAPERQTLSSLAARMRAGGYRYFVVPAGPRLAGWRDRFLSERVAEGVDRDPRFRLAACFEAGRGRVRIYELAGGD